jgi:hypothetical protein
MDKIVNIFKRCPKTNIVLYLISRRNGQLEVDRSKTWQFYLPFNL